MQDSLASVKDSLHASSEQQAPFAAAAAASTSANPFRTNDECDDGHEADDDDEFAYNMPTRDTTGLPVLLATANGNLESGQSNVNDDDDGGSVHRLESQN